MGVEMLRRLSFFCLVLVMMPVAVAQETPGLAMRPELTLAHARSMVAACEDFAGEKGLAPLSMAVYDAAGNLKLFSRQDGAMLVTVEFAGIKARTSAALGMSTKVLGDDVEFADKERPFGLRWLDNLTMVQGGVPITTAGGQLLGGIGVSGAASADDEACAQAGVDAISDALQ